MEMEIFLSSSVIAAIIAAITALIVTKIEFRNSLKLNRQNEATRLLAESFDEFRNALAEVDFVSPRTTGDMSFDINAMFAALFEAANKKRILIHATIRKVKFLLPKEQSAYFLANYDKLEKAYTSLKFSSRIATGDYDSSAVPINIEIIPSEEINSKLKAYIGDVDNLADELEGKLGDILRESLDIK